MTGTDNASEASDEESVAVHTQVGKMVFSQGDDTPDQATTINSDLVLLDSQSMVN